MNVENHDGSSFQLSLKLSFDFNAMALVEDKLGMSMLSGEVFENPSAKHTMVLLWAAMQENHPEYEGEDGLECVGTMLNLKSAKEALEAITKAFVASLPKSKVDELNSKPKEGDDPNVPSAS